MELAGQDRPDWSPDGSLIVFIGDSARDTKDVYVVHPDGSGLTRLTHAAAGTTHYAASFAPDGTRITFSRTGGSGPEGRPDVFTMAVDGSDVRAVTHSSRWDSGTDWGTAPLVP